MVKFVLNWNVNWIADEKYYTSEVIKCKDGSRSLTIDRLNDNFCDCVDGTDEPGDVLVLTGLLIFRIIVTITISDA